MNEVRLDDYLVCRESSSDVFRFGEFGQRNVGVHLGIPGVCDPVEGQHSRHNGRSWERISIAPVTNAWPREKLGYTEFACRSVSRKVDTGTDEAVIGKHLDDRHTG